MERADSSTVHLEDVQAGGDVEVHTTTLQIFVGSSWRSDQSVSVAPDGTVRVESAAKKNAVAAHLIASSPYGGNPYKGLESFDEADADRFFGREEAIELLWQRCRVLGAQTVGNAALLPVVGPSGSGKSSLVRAGLLPALARKPLPGLGNSRVAVMKPGSHPIDTLAAVLARVASNEPLPAAKQKEFADLLIAADADGTHHALSRISRLLTGQGQPLIIFVDQFEEIWSLCDSAAERNAFVAGLLDAAADRDVRVSVILTLRSDCLSAASGHPALSQAMTQNAFLVPAMSEAELRRAIAEPARQAGLPFDEATVELMVSEIEGREGALPLLQFALVRIWEGLKSGVSAAETLRQLGGVGGALAKEAERLYQSLPEKDQNIVRRAFLAQVRLGEGTRDSRRRADLDEMVAVGENREHVLAVLRRFAQPGERLITLGSDPDGGAVTVELTHEALLEHWSDLRKWIAASRDDLRFQRRLQDATEEWTAQGRPEGSLWRSPMLDLLRTFHKRKAADMTPVEIEFLKASVQQQSRERWRRRGTRAAAFGAVLLVAAFALWRNYERWLVTRPWGRLISLSTGQSYELSQDTAMVGRPVEQLNAVKHQVALTPQRISRIHLSIARGGIATDWRSLYGSTLNGQPLRYGDSAQLADGDILALSGLQPFVYRTIDWQPWHYLRAPEPVQESSMAGWAVIVDGRNRAILPITSDTAYITVRNETIGVSDAPGDDAILAVRRHEVRDQAIFRQVPFSAVPWDSAANLPDSYVALVLDPNGYPCKSKGATVLTVEPLVALETWIKSGDYNFARLDLPQGEESFVIAEGDAYHGMGELMYNTAAGWIQVVPTRAADIGEICVE